MKKPRPDRMTEAELKEQDGLIQAERSAGVNGASASRAV
jgi:hypothetical protein